MYHFLVSQDLRLKLNQNSLAQLPAEEQAQYRQFVAALIEAGAGAVTDLNGIIVRGDEVEPGTPVWIGHLKVKDVKMPQKVCSQRFCCAVLISHSSSGFGGSTFG
jgi:hypothetical protein